MQDEETEAPLAIDGPGVQLKALREAQHLDVSRIAVQLHLSEDTLNALERDRFDELPGAVFVQGYLRKYARLLGVSEAPIMEAYHQLMPESKRTSSLKINKLKQDVGSGDLMVKLVTWVIIIGLLALVFIWWKGYLKWPDDTFVNGGNEPAEEISSEMDISVEPSLPPLPQLMPETGEEPDSEQQEQIQPAEERSEVEVAAEPQAEGSLPLPVVSEQEVAIQPQPVEVEPIETVSSEPEGNEVSAPVVEVSEVTIDSKAETMITFQADSWVDIRDSAGDYKLLGIRKAGEIHRFGGKSPYTMILGNVAGVLLTLKGEVVDLVPYTRSNVARFSFDPDDIN
ncbi:MAG: helix-turn-helix domain-containing protein [Gammaproteobacteria bacterium]|nr:helix-turn-helix domain-containing protein [Gammaproteobacteria bacterium]